MILFLLVILGWVWVGFWRMFGGCFVMILSELCFIGRVYFLMEGKRINQAVNRRFANVDSIWMTKV